VAADARSSTVIVAGVLDNGSLAVETFTHFTDKSGRSDHHAKQHICKLLLKPGCWVSSFGCKLVWIGSRLARNRRRSRWPLLMLPCLPRLC
jgi:hypothetical protein